MSSKKVKIFKAFRLDSEVVDSLKKLPEKDPLIFTSETKIVEASLYHFINLPKPQQKEILSKYLTKDL